MDPKQGPPLFPVFEDPLSKPGGCSNVMTFPRTVVIFGRIRRGEPTSDLLLQLFPCDANETSIHTTREVIDNQRFILFISLVVSCILTNVRSQL
jgi:hypothetical protein